VRGRQWNTRGGVNLFRVHCIRLWNYHNETLSYYDVYELNSKIKKKKKKKKGRKEAQGNPWRKAHAEGSRGWSYVPTSQRMQPLPKAKRQASEGTNPTDLPNFRLLSSRLRSNVLLLLEATSF
jgi:hypothetical protein